MTYKQTNKVLEISEELIEKYSTVLCESFDDPESSQTVMKTSEMLREKIARRNSKQKRVEELQNNPLFVPPEQRTLSLKWMCKLDPNKDIPNHVLVQTIFHYVSILKTLAALFNDPNYSKVYFEYNLIEKHACTDGVWMDYCCAKNARNCNLFDDPKTIVIDIGIDDVELCSGLKTKAGKYKITAIYFRIRNLPHMINSRLENIHLLALCSVEDMKQEDVSLDDIFKLIIDEISTLQTKGIELDDKTTIKGTLANICADNLGANEVFGLIKCFSTDGFCRVCECTKEFSESQVEEVAEIMRIKNTYFDHVQISKEGDNKGRKGIVKYCLFNDLNHFHIFDNYSTDIMHDILEGVLQVFMHLFFDNLIDKKIVKSTDIIKMVRDFNYGILSRKNKPSIIIFKKPNLNQNATQCYNLFLNLPFIFYAQKNKIEDIWNVLELLLQILQIIFSFKITESDLTRLARLIPKFLSSLVEKGISLTPKMHHMVHYVTVIRNMGPLIHNWAMRIEGLKRNISFLLILLRTLIASKI